MDATLRNIPRSERDLLPEELIAKKLYEKCTDMKISKFKTAEEKRILTSIGENLGLDVDFKTLKKLYLGGKQIAETTLSARAADEMTRARNREISIFEAQIAEAAAMGRDKYLAQRPALKTARNKINVPNKLYGFTSSLEIDINNACLMDEAAKLRRRAYDVNEILRKGIEDVARKNAEDCVKSRTGHTTKEEVRAYIETRLIDINCEFEAERFPEVEMQECMVTKGRSFLVQGEVKCSEVVELFGKKAIVDGVYRLSVLDKDGEAVAEGVFAAPGLGQADLCKVGLINGYTFQAMCVTDTPEDIDPNGVYTCVASPIMVWAVEL